MDNKTIFKKGSTTYFFASAFFPKKIREDVYRLYSFVRVADDYVDQVPPQRDRFMQLERLYKLNRQNPNLNTTIHERDPLNKRVIKNIEYVARKYQFQSSWIDAFLFAMRSDLDHKPYSKLHDSLGYVYGSAEVVGLMMNRILGISPEADEFAKLQGRAMQWVNFIRDIKEDNELSRRYFPATDLKKFSLPDLSEQTARQNPERFGRFIRYQIKRYQAWQLKAEEGYKFIPRRLRIPVKTAAQAYNWTAEVIAENPLIVFDKKVKPTKKQLLILLQRNIRRG